MHRLPFCCSFINYRSYWQVPISHFAQRQPQIVVPKLQFVHLAVQQYKHIMHRFIYHHYTCQPCSRLLGITSIEYSYIQPYQLVRNIILCWITPCLVWESPKLFVGGIATLDILLSSLRSRNDEPTFREIRNHFHASWPFFNIVYIGWPPAVL